jgi:hypothetical protein
MERLVLAALMCVLWPGLGLAGCPAAPKEGGGKVSASAKKLAAAHATSVIAGGPVQLGECSDVPGDGHVAPRPNVSLMLAESDGQALEFRTRADCDTVLLVAAADGNWHFNDDDGASLDARLRLPAAPPGRYDVWIGTYGAGTCRARLIVETFVGSTPGGADRPALGATVAPAHVVGEETPYPSS